MMDGIKEETVGFLFNLQVQVEQAGAEQEAAAEEPKLLDKPVEVRAKGLGRAPRTQGLQYSAPIIDGAAGSGDVMVQRPEPEQQAPALGVGRATGAMPAPGRNRRPAPGQAVGSDGPSRNAPCPCGSGRKYKRCHGAPNGGA
jgi:preprotein translocase subunit SecA